VATSPSPGNCSGFGWKCLPLEERFRLESHR
jgi:hypothetical protein